MALRNVRASLAGAAGLLTLLSSLVLSLGHFAEDTEVSLADGTRRPLRDLRAGDEVLSFDEVLQRPALSTVVTIFEAWHPRDEIIQVSLLEGAVQLGVTAAQPLWSRSEGRVASFSPQQTREEYGLETAGIGIGLDSGQNQGGPLVLEDEQQGRVEAQVRAAAAEGRRLRPAPAQPVRVLTLSLWPHHWFFAQGVRVHNKGCFLSDAAVTMADGSRRPLGQILPGEAVASWDEVAQRPAAATVRARPSFRRREDELVQIELRGGSRLLATDDHPLWSRGRRQLVSLQPNGTREAYGLSAELLLLGEELEGETLEALPVVGLRRPASGQGKDVGEGQILDQRPYEDPAPLASAAADALGVTLTGWVDVQTLCLEEHHWFYVEGVRVHNKGCFLADAAVTLADGSRKPLGQFSGGEAVASWDEQMQQPAVATVRARPSFQRREAELVEIEHEGGGRLLATEDHPLWSSSRQQLVSLQPNSTREAYGLSAELLKLGEELESETLEKLSVLELRRPFLEGTAWVEVQTLCLEGHHWFYVEGVRVHNKGCFLGDAVVTLADGSRKPLGQFSGGETVASWDELAQQPAVATVRARPSFQRREAELVEIEHEGGGRLLATEDHPLWSRGRQRLVSLQPNDTRKAYGLTAELMQLGEELESEALEKLAVTALRRPFLEGSAWMEVQTLCLEPHHWFYVEGVRVHNKGCFAPWTPILMADGQQKPIEAIKIHDQVASWDEQRAEPSVANVSAVEVFPPRDLLEISFSQPLRVPLSMADDAAVVPRRAVDAAVAGGALVLTHDHPIYSARVGGLVSMDPEATLKRYGLRVGQMQPQELLQQHHGSLLEAAVRNWSGALDANLSKVMTLRLEGHHWFFAQGVRVHNKGGGGGAGSSSSGSSSGSRVQPATRQALGDGPYVAFIVLNGGMRRRYGTYYHQDDSCELHPTEQVDRYCKDYMWTNCSTPDPSICCYDCMDCEDEACVQHMDGCELFLANAFKTCEGVPPPVWVIVLSTVLGLVAICTICGCTCFICMKAFPPGALAAIPSIPSWGGQQDLQRLSAMRQDLQPSQGGLPPFLNFCGHYTENGETKPATYQLSFRDGFVTGTGLDDDGQAQINGKVYLPKDTTEGEIRWLETRPGVSIELFGSLKQIPPRTFTITGSYLSSFRSTRGTLALTYPPEPTAHVAGVGVPLQGNVLPAIIVGQPVSQQL